MTADRRMRRARAAKAAHEGEFLRQANVVGVGIGLRRRRGQTAGEPIIVVSVSEISADSELGGGGGIPREVDGVPVEVRVVGRLGALVAHTSRVRARHGRKLLDRRNVVGVGVGYKRIGGVETEELSVVVLVARKLPADALALSDRVPERLDGVRTDVIETGILFALGTGPRDRWRPIVPPGVSIGHPSVTAATFGCLVCRGERVFILSNNHVLANTNAARIGDPVLQPGPADGGTADDQIGVLSGFVPIDFGTQPSDCKLADWAARAANALASALRSDHRVQAVRHTDGMNYVDAALAEPLARESVRSEILYIGPPIGVGAPALGMHVQKTGRTSGYTQGTVAQIDATVRIDYGGKDALFAGQFIAGPMSQPGDSGSIVLDMDRRVVGLLFAGSDLTTVCNPISQVLPALDVELLV